MAMVTGSDCSRPDGPFPLHLRSPACSCGFLCNAHGMAGWFHDKSTVHNGVHVPKAPSGKNENPVKATLENSWKPETGPYGRGTEVGGAGRSKRKAEPRRRVWLGRSNGAESAVRAPAAAAKRIQKEIKWTMLEKRSGDTQIQYRKLSDFRSKKTAGQVFVKKPYRDLVQKRGLLSVHAKNGCAEEVSRSRNKTQGPDDVWTMHSPAELKAMRFRGASCPCKLNTAVKITCSTVQTLTDAAQYGPSSGGARTSLLLHQELSGKQKTDFSAPFQILIILLSGKSLLQWVRSSGLVQDLKQFLEDKEGIPTDSQRLIYEGKQLVDFCPLSFYNIQRNSSITFSLRLRGGALGQSSSAAASSYKDAVHAQKPKEKALPAQAPKPFLVDKLEETPSIEIMHPTMDRQHQLFAERGIICRFNGLWPRTADLYQWIHSNWTNNCKVLLCSKGFFITVFVDEEDYQRVLTEGPWFWNSAGLFLTPWFQDFDPSTAVITKLPIWVRLPNLPAHLWHFAVFEGIGNSLGRFLSTDTSRGEKGIYTFARICAEIDISKGLPDQIILKIGDFHWTQTLDFENTAFRCRNCRLTGHLQSSCPSMPSQKKKANSKPKSKSWKPHDPPPMDVFSSSDEEDEEEDEEVMDAMPAQVSPSVCHEEATGPPISQKRTHESSPSDSDKELSTSDHLSLQILPDQQSPNGWVKVGKKKGKKGRPNDSTLAV